MIMITCSLITIFHVPTSCLPPHHVIAHALIPMWPSQALLSRVPTSSLPCAVPTHPTDYLSHRLYTGTSQQQLTVAT